MGLLIQIVECLCCRGLHTTLGTSTLTSVCHVVFGDPVFWMVVFATTSAQPVGVRGPRALTWLLALRSYVTLNKLVCFSSASSPKRKEW